MGLPNQLRTIRKMTGRGGALQIGANRTASALC